MIRVFCIAAFALSLTLSACDRASQVSKAENYDLEEKSEPTCQLDIRLPSPEDSKRFVDTLARFAAAHQIPVASARARTSEGKELPRMYSNDDILIAPLLIDFPPIPPEQRHGQIRIHVLRRTFPSDRFIALANDFHATFRTEFGDLVQLWEEPNEREKDLH